MNLNPIYLAPVPAQKPIPKQTTPQPPVEAPSAPISQTEEAGFSQVPTQNQSRENRNQENRYNRDSKYKIAKSVPSEDPKRSGSPVHGVQFLVQFRNWSRDKF